MTPEQQLTIRAELARRMGYFVLPVGTPNQMNDRRIRFIWHYQLQLPDASKYQRWRETESEAWADAPDPFTNAEDKDALVAWLAADDDRWLPFKKELRLEWVASTSPRAASLDYERWMLTLPCEVIVIAAARALGIPEASE